MGNGKVQGVSAARFPILFACLALASSACNPPVGPAPTGTASKEAEVVLGTAGNFNVLGASTVTNTGPTVIAGDVGLSPGTAVTGFPPGLVTGTIHAADASAVQAQADLSTAYTELGNTACQFTLANADLAGLTLTPGVYCFSAAAVGLTGALTLDAQNHADAVFIFKILSTLTTASSASVIRINGGSDCNVFWQVGSSATLGTGTQFRGNILAQASITATTGATVAGRLLARTGAVTLDTNTVTACMSTPPVDAGQPVVDAGVPLYDGGLVVADAGLTLIDAGVLTTDAGTPVVDAGTPVVDAGTEDCDAGEVILPVVDAGIIIPVVLDAGAPTSCETDTCCNGATTSCCGGACVDLANDDNNCGSCGNVCGSGECCHQGSCSAVP